MRNISLRGGHMNNLSDSIFNLRILGVWISPGGVAQMMVQFKLDILGHGSRRLPGLLAACKPALQNQRLAKMRHSEQQSLDAWVGVRCRACKATQNP